VGLRSLAQVLLGVLALFVEMWTAMANGTVHVGTADIGAPLLLGAFVADVIVLVVVSVSGRRASEHPVPRDEESPLYQIGCSRCGWTSEAETIEQARALGRQHTLETHRVQP
jgi:hypothetical protein